MATDERRTDGHRTPPRHGTWRARAGRRPALCAAALLALAATQLAARAVHAQSTAALDTERPPDLPHDDIPPPTAPSPSAAPAAHDAPDAQSAPAATPSRPEREHPPRFRWGVSGGLGAGFAINPFASYPRAASGFGAAMFSLRLGSQRGLRDAVFYQVDSLFWVAPSARVIGFSLMHSINYERTERGGLYFGAGAAVMTSTAVCTNCGGGPGFEVSVGLPLRIGVMLNSHEQSERRRAAVRLGVEVIPTMTVPAPSFFVPVLATAGYEAY